MTEKHLPPLDLTGPVSQVAKSWRKWKRAFEYYAEGKDVENVRKKTSQLLHFAGMEYRTYLKIYRTLALSQRRVRMLTKVLFAS